MEHSMKWYKFIIYVQLFLNAILSVVSAINIFSGSYYGDRETADLIYQYYGSGLKIFDIVIAVLFIGLAVMAILARKKLKNFEAGAPEFYLKFLALDCAIAVVQILGASLFVGELIADSSTIGNIVGCIAMIGINKTYFDKRAELFYH